MSDTSLSLLDRLGDGSDPDCWRQWVAVYSPLLRSWLRRYDVLQPADVEDIIQEALTAVARELPGYRHNQRPGSFRRWLRLILVHRLRNFWKTRRRNPAAVGGSDFQRQLDELSGDASAESRQWDLQHDRHLMNRLLKQVEPRFAAHTWSAFRRHVLDGESPADVAAELDMPLHSVYAAKSRVLAALRQEAGGLIG